MKRLLAALLLLASARAETGDGEAEAPGFSPPPGIAFERDVVYGRAGGMELKLDVLRPEGEAQAPRPAVIFIHGGGHTKADGHGRLVPLARKGFYCVSIEFRSGKEAPFPARLQDAKCAVRYLRAHAKALGVDADHIGVWGSSAGGHAASLLGTTAGRKEFEGDGGWPEASSRVQCFVSWLGPADLTALAGLGAKKAAHLEEYLGVELGQDGDKDLLAKASPVTYASKDAAPGLLVHGDKDPVIPVDQAVRLHDALKKAGADVTLRRVPDGAHGGPAFKAEQAPTLEFLERHLSGD